MHWSKLYSIPYEYCLFDEPGEKCASCEMYEVELYIHEDVTEKNAKQDEDFFCAACLMKRDWSGLVVPVKFQGVDCWAPNWARWLAQDKSGTVYASEFHPYLNEKGEGYFWLAYEGRSKRIGHICSDNFKKSKTRIPSNKRILKLTVTRQWFLAHALGKKPAEYRIIKDWSISRLIKKEWQAEFGDLPKLPENLAAIAREYDEVEFTNGYGPKAPFCRLEWKGLSFSSEVKPQNGEDLKEVNFAILVGDVLKGRILAEHMSKKESSPQEEEEADEEEEEDE
ncbi:MAG: hypothetical protein HRT88_23535, partial [Lentisphaeraceae bacterium]|nr:hypothetical protein [Lentisphaeraceae bacterium]